MKIRNQDMLTALARAGAPHRIKALEQELQQIYETFPDLFPNGRPVVSGPDRREIGNRTAKAKKLIDQVEALHGRGNDLVVISEAARILGLSPAGVRNWVDGGRLPIADHNGPRKSIRVSMAKAKAIWDGSPANADNASFNNSEIHGQATDNAH